MHPCMQGLAAAKEALAAAKSKLSASASAARQGRRVMRVPLVPQSIHVSKCVHTLCAKCAVLITRKLALRLHALPKHL